MTALLAELIVASHAKPIGRPGERAVSVITRGERRRAAAGLQRAGIARPSSSYVSHYAVRHRRENGALITAIMRARTKTRITVRNAPGTGV